MSGPLPMRPISRRRARSSSQPPPMKITPMPMSPRARPSLSNTLEK